MPEQSPQTILWACAAGVSVGCIAYVIVTTLQAGRAEARRFRSMGRHATSPWFKVMRPLGRALGFLLGGTSARAPFRGTGS